VNAVSNIEKKRLLTRQEACEYVGLGLTRGVEYINQSGARIKIGNRCMYDKKILDQFIDKQVEAAKQHGEDESQD